MDRQTLRDWVHRFNGSGLEGLVDNWTEGPKPRLSAEQLAQFAQIVEAGPNREKDGVVRWRRLDLKRHRHDAAPPQRNLAQRRRGRPRCSAPRPAGWHTTGKLDGPGNITPIFLPSRAPELNPVENVWQYLRQNWLSNTVFENYDAIVDAACAAWRKLIAQPETITSIGMRDWAHLGQTL